MLEAITPPMHTLLKLIGMPFKPFLPLIETPGKTVLGGILLLVALIVAVRIAAIVS